MDPITAGIGLAVAGASASALGSVVKGNADAANFNAQAQADDYNAEVAKRNADQARLSAGAREDALRRRAAQVLGGQRAAVAQSHLVGSEGSLALVQEQSHDAAELDALMVRYEGNLQAKGFGEQATLDTYSAQVARGNARVARAGGYFGAAASLLQGGATAYGIINRPAPKTT